MSEQPSGPSPQAMWNENYTPEVVTGRDCEWAAWLYKQYGRKSTFLFWDTVRDLMLAGFCLCLFIGCSSTPKFQVEAIAPELFTVSVASMTAKQDDTLTAVKENTTAIEKIVTKINSLEEAILETRQAVGTTQLQLEAAVVSQSQREEVILQESGAAKSGDRTASDASDVAADTYPAENANVSHTSQQDVAEAGDVPLYVSVTNFCRPCNQLKRDWKAGKLKGFNVTFCVETETHRQQLIAENIPAERVVVDTWNGTPFPAIRHRSKDSASGWVAKIPHGYGPQVLHELRRDLLGINGEGIEYEYPQTSTGGEPVGSIFPYRADGEIRGKQDALRFVSWWSPRSWRKNFVSRAGGSSGAYP